MNREILLIEDDASYRESIKFLFEGEPYQFVEAASPNEGIAALKDRPHLRVILLDLSFDYGGKASAVLEHIKDRSSDYRVIILTGHDELLLAERASEYEVFNYLPKAQRSSIQAIRFSVDQAFKDLERADLARKVNRLLEVQKRVNDSRDTEATLNLICESVRSTVGAYTCHIRVYDSNHGDYRLKGFAGPEEKIRRVFERPRSKGELFSGKVVASGEATSFPDLQAMEEFRRFKEAALESSEVSSEKEGYWQKIQSAYIVPIPSGLFGNVADAVLNVSSESAGFFGEEKKAQVDEFVTLVALTIAKDWLKDKSEEIHQDYSEISGMLGEISDQLKGPAAQKGVYEVVTRRVAKIINAEVISIFLYNESTGLVENVAELRGSDLLATPIEVYKPGQSLTGAVYASDKTIHLPQPGDVSLVKPLEDKRFDHANKEAYLRVIPSGKIEHYLGVPIRISGRIRGVLRAINHKSEYYSKLGHQNALALLERGFSRDSRNALEITASHLAVAIRNAELLGEKDRQVEQISLLGEVGQLINSELDIDRVLNLTTRKMAEVMRAEICMLFLKDGGDRIVLKQCFGMPMIPDAFYKLGDGITGTVVQTGRPRLIKRVEESDGKYDHEIRAFLKNKHGEPKQIESMMVVPIIAKNTIVGAMKVINKVGDHLEYSDNDLKQFQMFGNYVSVAVENAQVYKVANDRLAVAERNAALSQLVMAVAHEINNTSGIIPANVTGIKAQLGASNTEIDTMLASIVDAASQATEFANEIAGFSAKWRGEKEALDLNKVIHGAINLQKYKNWTNTRLEVELCANPLVCEIYSTPFIQIVRNIVINAFQALENHPEGVVRVSTSKRIGELGNSAAVIEIQDNGPGIQPANIKRIFDADFTTKPKGNGVGLWLTRTQLELIGGKIDVESEHGRGAKFIISIPISGADEGSHDATGPSADY